MGSNYIAIWPYVTTMGDQVLDNGRPGFLNLLGSNSPQEMGLTGVTVAKFYETLAKYGVLITRKEPSEYSGSELRQAKSKIEKALKGTSGYGTPTGTDKLVLELGLKLIKDLQKDRSKAGLSSFWDTLVNISGAGKTDETVPPPSSPPTNNDDDKPKSKLPLILGITAGVAVLGITVMLIMKNRNKKMILIENQEKYANEPIVITARNFVDPTEVIAGLINKGQQMYETGRGVAETIGGANVNTNIGGYDVTVSKNTEAETKIMGISKPIFYTGAVALGALVVIGVVYAIKRSKKNK